MGRAGIEPRSVCSKSNPSYHQASYTLDHKTWQKGKPQKLRLASPNVALIKSSWLWLGSQQQQDTLSSFFPSLCVVRKTQLMEGQNKHLHLKPIGIEIGHFSLSVCRDRLQLINFLLPLLFQSQGQPTKQPTRRSR